MCFVVCFPSHTTDIDVTIPHVVAKCILYKYYWKTGHKQVGN